MWITRRRLQLALGLLWLLDGALQLQPFMFGTGFARQVIAPAGEGQPGPVHAAVSAAAGLIATHPAGFDAVFAVVQLALGFGLLFRRTARVALAASVAWALGVWLFGEGLGGLLGGQASLLTGAPGAALLYAVLAVAVWPARSGQPARTPRWLPGVWALLWLGAAVLQLLPGQASGRAVAADLTGQQGAVPTVLAGVSNAAARWASGHGTQVVVGLAVLFVAVGLAGLRRGWWRASASWAGATLGLAAWVLAEGFGGLVSGQATDPNTGPLLVLLAAATAASAAVGRVDVAVYPPEPAMPRAELAGELPGRR